MLILGSRYLTNVCAQAMEEDRPKHSEKLTDRYIEQLEVLFCDFDTRRFSFVLFHYPELGF